MNAVPVLLIGDVERPEFEPALAALAAAARAPSIERAIVQLAVGDAEPAVVVLAQSFPGQIAADDVEKLRRAAPLARIVGLLGSWCEGETRTGAPWPTVARYYGHQAAARLAGDLEALRDGGCPTWGLPATISEDERIVAAVPATAPREAALHRGVIVIRSRRDVNTEWLAAACRSLGHRAIEAADGEVGASGGASAGLWEGRIDDAPDAADLARFVKAIAPAPVVALLDFPRTEHRRWAVDAGAAAVVSKPFLLGDLEAELERLARRPR